MSSTVFDISIIKKSPGCLGKWRNAYRSKRLLLNNASIAGIADIEERKTFLTLFHFQNSPGSLIKGEVFDVGPGAGEDVCWIAEGS